MGPAALLCGCALHSGARRMRGSADPTWCAALASPIKACPSGTSAASPAPRASSGTSRKVAWACACGSTCIAAMGGVGVTHVEAPTTAPAPRLAPALAHASLPSCPPLGWRRPEGRPVRVADRGCVPAHRPPCRRQRRGPCWPPWLPAAVTPTAPAGGQGVHPRGDSPRTCWCQVAGLAGCLLAAREGSAMHRTPGGASGARACAQQHAGRPADRSSLLLRLSGIQARGHAGFFGCASRNALSTTDLA
jgi:hypothetical protein